MLIHLDIKNGYDDNTQIDMKFRVKKIKGNKYIYGRVWWDGDCDGMGGRREISLGSITKIIDDINICIYNGENGFPTKSFPKSYKHLTFDVIKKDKILMECIGLLGKNKFRSFLHKKLLSRRSLGYRIRCKDMSGYSKSYDVSTLLSNPNNMDVVEMDNIIKTYVKDNDTKWYENVIKMREKITPNK